MTFEIGLISNKLHDTLSYSCRSWNSILKVLVPCPLPSSLPCLSLSLDQCSSYSRARGSISRAGIPRVEIATVLHLVPSRKERIFLRSRFGHPPNIVRSTSQLILASKTDPLHPMTSVAKPSGIVPSYSSNSLFQGKIEC